MDNEWKDSLRERFSDYSAPEPEGLWEGIEQGIAGKPRSKMLPVWLATGLAAAAAIALVVFLPTRKPTEPDVLQKQGDLAVVVPADKSASDTELVEGPEVTVAEPVEATETVVSKSVPFAVVSRHTLLSEAEPIPSVPVSKETIPDAVHEILPIEDPPVSKEKEAIDNNKKTEQRGQSVAETLQNMIPSLEISPAPARKRFSISAYGHGGQASNEQMKGYGMNQTGAYLGTRAIGGNTQNNVGGMMRTLASNKASTFEALHAGPVRMGVTAAWELVPHLSLLSGLNWTTLHSEFDESVEPFHTVTEQDLGFLGVPLRLGTDWNIWKGLYVHASAGGMVEKGLLSSSRTNSWVEGQDAESTKNPAPDTGGLFWSVGASAGAEYRFNDFIGLYLTPGIEYHFKNGAPVRCAYTERPLHWNAELGIRFHFGK